MIFIDIAVQLLSKIFIDDIIIQKFHFSSDHYRIYDYVQNWCSLNLYIELCLNVSEFGPTNRELQMTQFKNKKANQTNQK